MRTRLLTVMLTLVAWSGLVQGQQVPVTPVRVSVASPDSNSPPPPDTFSSEVCRPEAVVAAPAARGQFWLRGEYLLWWTSGSSLPALATTGIPGSTSLPGAIGQAGTTVLYGDSEVDRGPRSGGRFTAGFWCDSCRTYGIEGSYFFLCSRSTDFDAASDSRPGSSFISRPFFDVLTGVQNSQIVAFPLLTGGQNLLTATGLGLASGDFHASTFSRFQGGDLNALCGLCSGCNYRVLFLGGFRYLQLDEGISITENTRVNPALPAGTPFFGGGAISITDRFETRNSFYGGQFGVRGEVSHGKMFLEVQGKLALGMTHQVVDINGSTTITQPGGATTVTPIGFLASGSNSGSFSQDRFSVVPEVGINGGCQITNHLRAFVGYNFLYWSSVVRPADQIDVGLSGTQIPTDPRFNPAAGPARPAALLQTTGFWAQGISFGAELRY